MTSSVTEDQTDDHIHGDPLKEHLAKHFCHGTDMVDPLVAQVSTLEDKSCTSKADPSTIPSAFSNMLWDCDATANKYNKARVLTAQYKDTVDAKIRELESSVIKPEWEHKQIINERLTSIPSASTVEEWAHSATKDYLEKLFQLEEITLASKTATTSITASSALVTQAVYRSSHESFII